MIPEPFRAAEEQLEDITDPDLRSGLVQLFVDAQDLIAAGQVSLVVLTARRLGCLYQALVKVGMPRLTGCKVVGDRYFDMDPRRDLPDERILILDDSVVVGTTLERFSSRLERRVGNGQVRAKTVVLDAEQHVPFLTDNVTLEAFHQKPTADVNEFSLSVVRTLFRLQVPYFSDFAVTNPVRLTRQQWQAAVSNEHWHVVDVSSPLIADETHHAFSFVATEQGETPIRQGIAAPLTDLVGHVKFRVYVRWDGDEALVTIVPLALLRPCTSRGLRESMAAIGKSCPSVTDLEVELWKPEAVQRLLQMLASIQSLKAVWSVLCDTGTVVQDLRADAFADLPLELHFGERSPVVRRVVDAVLDDDYRAETVQPPVSGLQPSPSRLLDSEEVRESLWRAREMLAHLPIPSAPKVGEVGTLGGLFQHAVLEAFGLVHATLEEGQRKQIAAYTSLDDYRADFQDPDERYLSHGLSGRELTTELLPHTLNGSAWERAQILLTVDVGNDLGVVVPATRYDEARDVVYRTYRLGETANLVDTPLWRLAEEDAPEPDRFTRALDTSEATSLAAKTFPGAVVSRYDGVVEGVRDKHFTATLTDPVSGVDVPAELSLDQLADADLQRIGPGRRFVWTVFQSEGLAGRSRISRLRLLEEPPLRTEDFAELHPVDG